MKRQTTLILICTPIQLMFTYAAVSKWMEFEKFKVAMMSQPIPSLVSTLLIYTLPLFEMSIVLLLFAPFQKRGLYLSALTMLTFSVYIFLGITGAFKQMPCSCGGILGEASLINHLWFNIIFLIISLVGTFTIRRKEAREN